MKVLAALLLLGAILVPVVISVQGDDHFRLPKQLVLYAVAITATAIFAIGWTLRRLELDADARRRLRIPAILGAAGLLWAALATLFSTNRALSIDAWIWGAALVALFLLAVYTLRDVPVPYLAAALFLPALVNSVVLILQATNVWNPWEFARNTPPRLTHNALLGNPDDVGVYLAAAALFALALTAAVKRFRIVYGVIAAIVIAALLASQTLTAIGAFSVAVVALILVRNRKLGVVALVALPIVVTTVLFVGPTRDRAAVIMNSILHGQWGGVISGRLLPFASAWHMFLEHPVAGVGPGCFKFHYMDYRIHLREATPGLYALSGTQAVNFGEAHNDHLQILAEMGLPGYLVLIAGILWIARISRGPRPEEGRDDVARTLAFPLAVLVLIIMLAQFALQLAAPAYSYLLLGAACLAWRSPDDVAA